MKPKPAPPNRTKLITANGMLCPAMLTIPKALNSDLLEKDLKIAALEDSSRDYLEEGSAPEVRGINSVLTLNFLTTLGATLIGFLICWVITMKNRALQFGLYRAMGLSTGKLILILVYEQFFISGAAGLNRFPVQGASGNQTGRGVKSELQDGTQTNSRYRVTVSRASSKLSAK